MFLIPIFYFLTSLIPVSLQTNNLVNILELKDNLFHTVNQNVHHIINKMFAILKLKPDFLKSTQIQPLIIMHSDLNNIGVKNFNIYKEITNTTKIEYSINANQLKLIDIINEIIKEFKNERNVIHTGETLNHNDHLASSSLESLDFLEDFLRKINNLTEESFTKEYLNNTFDNSTNIFEPEKRLKQNANKDRTKPNLKLWSPPTNLEVEELFNNLTNRRIYKGKRTRIKKYPFMASIHVMKEFMCAGSIISNDFVITAASCLQIIYNNKKLKANPSSIFIRIGSDYTKRFGETVPISEVHFHPEYESFSLKHNLVLLKMGMQIKLLKKMRKIRRIQYDKTAMRLDDVDEITILGWGATDNVFGVKTYQPLAVANIDVYDFEKCQEIYSKSYVDDTHFCVGFASKGGGACNKDVGGPGVVNRVLMGVISFGPPVCGAPDMPTVLLKLGFYAPWIESVIKEESSKVRDPELRTPAPLTAEEMPTTSSTDIEELYPQNPNYVRTGMRQDYPEEVAILNQMLNDVILSNRSIVDDILYGALEDDLSDIFKPSTKTHLHHHPLVNKSVFLLPDVHQFGEEYHPNASIDLTTSSPIKTTTHPGLNIDYLDVEEERIRYWQAASNIWALLTPPASRTPTTTTEPRYFTDRFGRARNITLLHIGDTESEYSKVVSSEDSEKVSDNYEAGGEIEEVSEGLSIDVEGFVQREEKSVTTRNIERLNTDNIMPPDGKLYKNNPEMESNTKQNLKRPYSVKKSRKVTQIILKNKLYADENFRSKGKNYKHDMGYKYQYIV